ncbi:ribonuclease III, partial [Hysterangium stoloniferum]
EDLPPLPRIISDAILLQVYTHRSVYARPTHLFEDAPGDPSPDNEKLEHLGDSVLGLCVTTLIRDMYPHIRVGPATKIRSIVVGNPTLASIAVRYQMHKILRLHPSQAITLRASANIQGIFLIPLLCLSYVAGVYLTRGLDVVRAWLTALMTPYIILAYRAIRLEYGLPTPSPSSDLHLQGPSPPESPSNRPPGYDSIISPDLLTPSALEGATSGHLSLLNQYLQQRNTAIDWIWTSEPLAGMSAPPKWVVRAMLGTECLGTGGARTKKAAKNMAAIQALKVLGVDVRECDISIKCV